LTEIASIKSATHQVGVLMFEKRAQECVQRSLREGNQEESIKEIVRVMGRFVT
ncbi:MAG: metal-sensing transcriptional repressor, partial [Syntrophomonadaceae bacterium]|nr:metal-sensing transcriptional repressor [Syntrophomonadaceae bacterium]